jgi:hypothetical protein
MRSLPGYNASDKPPGYATAAQVAGPEVADISIALDIGSAAVAGQNQASRMHDAVLIR